MPELFPGIFILSALRYFFFLEFVRKGIQKLSRTKPIDFRLLPPLSVVIPFRNESAVLEKNIQSLLRQNYPAGKAEFLYVNDESTDDFHSVFIRYTGDSRVKLIPADTGISSAGKKRALETGAREAKGDIIVFTDADCEYGPDWLHTVASCFEAHTDFVSAPVAFSAPHGAFAGAQQLEFSGLVLCGAGLIANAAPMICNGANIAFRAAAFRAVNGFATARPYTSGEDELLMRKIHLAKPGSVRFCYNPLAAAITAPSRSLPHFFAQRSRWASKGLRYPRWFLFGTLLPALAFYLCFILAPVFALAWGSISVFLLWLAIIFTKAVMEYRVLRFGRFLLGTRLSPSLYARAAVLQPLYIVLASLFGLFGRVSWKGRAVQK